ncbi:hypothetical protein [Leifsonia sp. LS-T14]|uniref:hypothetical protein n=1 Tax=unclassified Leifsonia TaxID=2663824 RepID=UPI0035A62131
MTRISRAVRRLAHDPAGTLQRARLELRLRGLERSNRRTTSPVTGDGACVVNLTSHGHRIATVHLAIESIAAGSVRPARLILWLDDEQALRTLPEPLVRLRARGLEILPTPDYGPHKKQYSYASTQPATFPLVTADDDVLYPRTWLADLLHGAAETPGVVLGPRTHTVVLTGDGIAPYAQWRPGVGTAPSYRTLVTGVSGVLYPPEFLAALRDEGERFRTVAPRADDIWVHSVAVRHGFRSRQLGERQAEYPEIPGTGRNTLYRENVVLGGNDTWIAASYGTAEVARMRRDDPSDRDVLATVTEEPAQDGRA